MLLDAASDAEILTDWTHAKIKAAVEFSGLIHCLNQTHVAQMRRLRGILLYYISLSCHMTEKYVGR